MTGREQLNRRLRPLVIGLYGGFAVVFASGVLGHFMERSPNADYLLVPLVIGISITVASMFVIQFGVRCPFCRLRLGQVFFLTGQVWRFGRNFNFCPNCGTSLDQETPT